MEINPSKPNRLKFLLGQNHGRQRVRHRTPVTETSCQRHWHSRGILTHQDIQRQQGRRSVGGFSDLKGYQTLKPPIKYVSRMPLVERFLRQPHSWNHQYERHFHEGNERQHAL